MSSLRSGLIIENDYWIVDLHPVGASVTRLFPRALGRSILRDSPRELTSGRFSAAFPVPTLFGPQLRDKVSLGGESYQMPVTLELETHGPEVDQFYRVTEHLQQKITFSLQIEDVIPRYPFRSLVLVDYELEERIFRMRTTVRNLEERISIPVMSVWHPYFVRYLAYGGEMGNHLRFSADVTEILRYDGSEPIPRKRAAPVLAHESFLRDRALVNPHDHSMRWRSRSARLYWPGHLDLTLRANGDWLHLYTGDEWSCCIEPALAPANGLWLAHEYQLPSYASIAEPGSERTLLIELEIEKFL